MRIGLTLIVLAFWVLSALAEDKAPQCQTERQQINAAFQEATQLLGQNISLKAENALLKEQVQQLQEAAKPKIGPEKK